MFRIYDSNKVKKRVNMEKKITIWFLSIGARAEQNMAKNTSVNSLAPGKVE